MSTCSSTTSRNFRCSRKARKGGLCSQHRQIQEATMYKKELKALHSKIRALSADRFSEKMRADDAEAKLEAIQRLDRIKVQLTNICPQTQYSHVIKNERFRSQLEKIFEADFDDIPGEYFTLLNLRNDLCHPFSRRLWN